jgi:hypothetical protein
MISTMAAPALLVSQNANAELIYGITFDNNLFSFDSATPAAILSGTPVTGLQAGEVLHAIDFRAANGQLYGLGSSSRLYTINPSTGAAAAVGGAFGPPTLSGAAFGMDFNPAADRVRVHSETNQNLRLNPDTGAIAAVDPNLFYAAGDSGAGLDPNIVASAYNNNDNNPSTSTTLFSIDSVRDTLNMHQGSPGFAEMVTVGTLRNAQGATIPFSDYSGFDISPSGVAYVQWNNANGLFGTVDLSTGIVTTIGNMGGGLFVRDIAAVIPEPASASALCLAAGILLLNPRRR